jgi:hypothetical protein
VYLDEAERWNGDSVTYGRHDYVDLVKSVACQNVGESNNLFRACCKTWCGVTAYNGSIESKSNSQY